MARVLRAAVPVLRSCTTNGLIFRWLLPPVCALGVSSRPKERSLLAYHYAPAPKTLFALRLLGPVTHPRTFRG